MNKKKVSLLGVILLAVLVAAASAMFLMNSGVVPFSKISMVAYAAGTPDALGNQITEIGFQQNSTGSFALVGNLVYTNYVLNYNLTIPANQHTLVYANVLLNHTLAADAGTALARCRVYLTISGVTTSAAMIGLTSYTFGSYWFCQFVWPSSSTPPTSTWIPATDTTYTITFQYQAYY